jgi:hypothetical protein
MLRKFLSNVVLSAGPLPEKVIVCIQRTQDLDGVLEENPFNFKDRGISSITLTTDSEFTSTQQNITIDSTSKFYLDGYRSLLSLIPNLDISNGISRDKYAMGSMFFNFNIRPRNLQSTMQTIVTGNIKIEVKFTSALTVPLTMIILGQGESSFSFNQNREFMLE